MHSYWSTSEKNDLNLKFIFGCSNESMLEGFFTVIEMSCFRVTFFIKWIQSVSEFTPAEVISF